MMYECALSDGFNGLWVGEEAREMAHGWGMRLGETLEVELNIQTKRERER